MSAYTDWWKVFMAYAVDKVPGAIIFYVKTKFNKDPLLHSKAHKGSYTRTDSLEIT
jgi:hypothetical protein